MKMQIEITNVSTSQKGTVWIQAKLTQGEAKPEVGELYEIKHDGNAEKKVKKGKNDDTQTA
jgi:hypothetical protein